MNKNLRNCVASAMLLLPAAVAMVAAPTAAMAQPAAPEVRSLAVSTEDGLEPGSRLTFRLVGTPRVKAVIRIRGLRENIALRETAAGVYVGRYTLKRSDRIAPDSEVRATLRHGNRTASASYALSEAMAAPPVVVAPPPPPLRIERFGMVPVNRLRPGVELQFALEGPPGSTVSVDLPGVERNLKLGETRPGHYEGNYTIRRSDDIDPNRPVVATLRKGDRVVTANLNLVVERPGAGNRPPSGDNRPPSVVNVTPRDGETVPAGPPVQIGGRFEDRRGSGVDPASVQITVSGRNVTREAQIDSRSFSFRGVLPPGRHTVDVQARDEAGNAVRQGWSFDVAVAAPVNVPIRILNHSDNGQIGNGPTLVQGHTVPNASVAVTVTAVAPMGGVLNISKEVFNQTLQADANGNFAFSFTPQFPIPGTRYELSLLSTRGNLRDEHRMVLVQR